MWNRICILLLVLLAASVTQAQTTIRSGKLSATVTPEQGVTELKLNGKKVFTGSTTHTQGALFTLLRDVPKRDWNWQANRDTNHYAPLVGKLVDKVGNWKKHATKVIRAEADRYVVEHFYEQGVSITYDHQLVGADLKLKVTIDNQTLDLFQLHDWLLLFVHCDSPGKIQHRMGSYYPAADVYSPVTCISDSRFGLGVNYVKHDFRPIEILLNPMHLKNQYQLSAWLKNSPIASGAQRSYEMVLRVDDTPGDWKHLLTPYKDWFTGYFGDAKYSMDFRLKVGMFLCRMEGISQGNPSGYYGQLDRLGWLPFFRKRVGHLRNYNTGEVIIWGASGASRRGVNYRPEFDVFPPVLERGLPQLKTFFNQLGNKRFGFFARPNTIAYQQTHEKDSDVSFNPLDIQHLRMADRRYDKLIKAGARAFYMDTYGADWGCFPDSAKASVFYLKHLRDRVGPDVLLVTEFGYDAFSVYASIWPAHQDRLGHIPFGEYARWLVKGSVDFCRVAEVSGARRVWQRGGVPMVNDFMVNSQLMQIQNEYVNPDGSSKVRQDYLMREKASSNTVDLLPAKNTALPQGGNAVDSLFKR